MDANYVDVPGRNLERAPTNPNCTNLVSFVPGKWTLEKELPKARVGLAELLDCLLLLQNEVRKHFIAVREFTRGALYHIPSWELCVSLES